MTQRSIDPAIKTEGHEPPFLVSTRFGRHGADGNVVVEVPQFSVQVSICLTPSLYMHPDFGDNWLHYIAVTSAHKKLPPDELTQAVALAVDFIGIDNVLPRTAEGEGNGVDIAVIYNEGFPQELAAVAAGLHLEGLLVCVPTDSSVFESASVIASSAGLAAMMRGGPAKKMAEASKTMEDMANNITGRRLSDAMPPSDTKH